MVGECMVATVRMQAYAPRDEVWWNVVISLSPTVRSFAALSRHVTTMLGALLAIRLARCDAFILVSFA
jgi:hypothetical protein